MSLGTKNEYIYIGFVWDKHMLQFIKRFAKSGYKNPTNELYIQVIKGEVDDTILRYILNNYEIDYKKRTLAYNGDVIQSTILEEAILYDNKYIVDHIFRNNICKDVYYFSEDLHNESHPIFQASSYKVFFLFIRNGLRFDDLTKFMPRGMVKEEIYDDSYIYDEFFFDGELENKAFLLFMYGFPIDQYVIQKVSHDLEIQNNQDKWNPPMCSKELLEEIKSVKNREWCPVRTLKMLILEHIYANDVTTYGIPRPLLQFNSIERERSYHYLTLGFN